MIAKINGSHTDQMNDTEGEKGEKSGKKLTVKELRERNYQRIKALSMSFVKKVGRSGMVKIAQA